MIVPTRRAALLALVVAAALVAYPGEDVAVWPTVGAIAAVIVLVVALDALVTTSPSKLVLARRHPPVVVVGQEATLTWEVRSELGRSVRVHLADELAPSLHARTRRFAVRVPPGGVREGRHRDPTLASWSVRHRARHPSDRRPARARVPSARGSDVLDAAGPPTVPLPRRGGAAHPSGPHPTDRPAHRTGLGGGTEFEQLREYGPDDEYRRIDWTATARAGKPIVRTYRAERNQSVLVMLDNGRVMAGRVDGVPRVEHGMDAVMMLTAVATSLGDRCGLVAFDREVRAIVPPARRVDQVAIVSEAMYDLEPELSESDYEGAFSTVVARFRRRTMLVLLTDLLEQVVADSLLPALPLITRTHLVVVAGVRDPAVEAWALGAVTDDESAYRRVAAVDALHQRTTTAARLRGLGVTVVDASPGRLAPDLADAYLLAKSTGRL